MMEKFRPQVMILGLGLIALGGYGIYEGMQDLGLAIGGGLISLLTTVVTGNKD